LAALSLSKQSSTARLNGLNLAEVNGGAAEAGWKLRDVKEDARGGLDGAQIGAGWATDAVLYADGLLEGTVLLGMVAVRAERGVTGRVAVTVGGKGLGQRALGRGRVRLGGVVDGGGNGTRTDKLDERGALGVHGSLAESASSEHCDGWWLFEDVGCGGLVDSKWYFFATSGESSEGIGEEVGWRLEELALVETLDRGGGKKVCSFSRARQGMTWAWAWVSVRWYRETGKKSV
jgi:hypothetical protein